MDQVEKQSHYPYLADTKATEVLPWESEAPTHQAIHTHNIN